MFAVQKNSTCQNNRVRRLWWVWGVEHTKAFSQLLVRERAAQLRSRCDDDLDSARRGCCIWAFKSGSNYFQTAALVLGQREGRSTTSRSTRRVNFSRLLHNGQPAAAACVHFSTPVYRQTKQSALHFQFVLLFLLGCLFVVSIGWLSISCLKNYWCVLSVNGTDSHFSRRFFLLRTL